MKLGFHLEPKNSKSSFGAEVGVLNQSYFGGKTPWVCSHIYRPDSVNSTLSFPLAYLTEEDEKINN